MTSIPTNELHHLVQNAIFELEVQMDKSWDRLLVLEGKIAQAQTMKSFIQDQDEKAGLMWTDLMEEKLVADMMRAAKLRAMHVAWNEDLRKFQAQLDAIVLELQE